MDQRNLRAVIQAIPKRCYENPTWKGLLWIARDLLIYAAVVTGLILVDNAFAFGQLFDEVPTDPEVGAVRDFNDLMARTTGLHGMIVPVGDGLWVAVVEEEAG